MLSVLMKYVNRTVSVQKADKAIEDSKDEHSREAANLYRRLIILIRNSFVNETEKTMRKHYDTLTEQFDKYVESRTTKQLVEDNTVGECEMYKRVFGTEAPI